MMNKNSSSRANNEIMDILCSFDQRLTNLEEDFEQFKRKEDPSTGSLDEDPISSSKYSRNSLPKLKSTAKELNGLKIFTTFKDDVEIYKQFSSRSSDNNHVQSPEIPIRGRTLKKNEKKHPDQSIPHQNKKPDSKPNVNQTTQKHYEHGLLIESPMKK